MAASGCLGTKAVIALDIGFGFKVQNQSLRRVDIRLTAYLAIHQPVQQVQHVVYPTTKEQRCWVHKMANITGAMPKPLHEKAKAGLQDIWMAETKKEATAAFDLFVETYGVKYERAIKKLTKDRDVLLTFYDFPAEHWKHIRTTNPIESVFASVRNRTRKTKGCLSRKTALSMVFKLMMSAKKKWRKLSGTNRLPEVIQGVEFKDGIKQVQNAA